MAQKEWPVHDGDVGEDQEICAYTYTETQAATLEPEPEMQDSSDEQAEGAAARVYPGAPAQNDFMASVIIKQGTRTWWYL